MGDPLRCYRTVLIVVGHSSWAGEIGFSHCDRAAASILHRQQTKFTQLEEVCVCVFVDGLLGCLFAGALKRMLRKHFNRTHKIF